MNICKRKFWINFREMCGCLEVSCVVLQTVCNVSDVVLAGRGQGRDSASEEQGTLQVCTNRNMDIDELLYNILTSPVLAIFPDSICVTSAPSEAALARAGPRQGRGQESASCSE